MRENVPDLVMLVVWYRMEWRMISSFLKASRGESGTIHEDRKLKEKILLPLSLSTPTAFWINEYVSTAYCTSLCDLSVRLSASASAQASRELGLLLFITVCLAHRSGIYYVMSKC